MLKSSTSERLYHSWGLFLIDVFCIAIALFASYMLRFDFGLHGEWSDDYRRQFLYFLPAVIILRLCIYASFKLYKGVQFYVSVNEAALLAMATLLGSVALSGANAISGYLALRAPWAVVAMEGILSFLLVGGNRFWPRFYQVLVTGEKETRKRLIVIGANHAGVSAARSLAADAASGYRPVAFIDENSSLHGRRIDGIPVLGDIGALNRVVGETKADEILIALPDASPRDMRAIVHECEKARLQFRRIPGVSQVMDDRVTINELPPVEVEDLLGRPSIKLQLPEGKNYLHGERVMITGAGGSIGSEICRQIMGYEPERLILVGKGENSIYEIASELHYQQHNDRVSLVIGDVGDEAKMRFTFAQERPTVVFHAAAHKHVPLMQLHPEEAVKNNILASVVLARLADRFAVKHFIQISTDKAVRPTNVMGASKRVAEMAIQSLFRDSKTNFYVVRFGNVLGSRGSVIPLLKRQIAQGGPLTITHPDVTRYFMTIPEAVNLVIQTGALGGAGKLFVLDMGQPVRIVDLARNMITLSGYEPDVDIDIQFIGLRPGEKLTEELLTQMEGLKKTELGKVFVVEPEPIDREWMEDRLSALQQAALSMERETIDRLLREIVPAFQPAVNGAEAPSSELR